MEGVLQCLPIFALSLSCQTQLFVISNELPDSSPSKMDSIVGGAVNLCSFIYLSVRRNQIKTLAEFVHILH